MNALNEKLYWDRHVIPKRVFIVIECGIKKFEINFDVQCLFDMNQLHYIFALALANLAFSCNDVEFEAIRNSDSLIYLIHSIDDLLNSSSSRQVLMNMLLSENKQLPSLFNSSAWRLGSRSLGRQNTLRLCGNAKETFDTQSLLSPKGSTAIGVLYGCNIKSKVNAMIVIFDETQQRFKKWTLNNLIAEMPADLRPEVCRCSDMADDFIQNCVHSQRIKNVVRQSIVFVILVLIVVGIAFLICKHDNH